MQSVYDAYDEYGNRKSLTHTGTENYTVGYTYDMNNRLLSESKTQGSEISTANYTYDKNGNQLKKVKSVYAPNSEEKSSVGIMFPEAENSYYESYEYNLFGKLTKAAKNGKIALYTYDGNGERQSKTVNGTETKEVWSGGNIVAETNGSGEVAANYYYGIRLYGAKTEGKDVYYSYNGHGDTTGLTDTSGNVAASYEYDAFGNQTEAEGDIYNPFRYAGQYTDDETGLIYLRNRYYDPEIGRFTQEDPVRDGVNWYTYCYNNPILFTDPWGLGPGLYLNETVINQEYFDDNYTSGTYAAATDIVSGYYGYVEYGQYGDYIFGVGDYVFVLDPNSIGIQELGYAEVRNKYNWQSIGEVRYTKTWDVNNEGCIKMQLNIDDMAGVADKAGIKTQYAWELGPDGGTFSSEGAYFWQYSEKVVYVPTKNVKGVYNVDYAIEVMSVFGGESFAEIGNSLIAGFAAAALKEYYYNYGINQNPPFIKIFSSSVLGSSDGPYTIPTWDSFHICRGTSIGHFSYGNYYLD